MDLRFGLSVLDNPQVDDFHALTMSFMYDHFSAVLAGRKMGINICEALDGPNMHI